MYPDHAGAWQKLVKEIPVTDIVYGEHLPGFDSWYIGAKSFDKEIPASSLRLNYGDIDTFI